MRTKATNSRTARICRKKFAVAGPKMPTDRRALTDETAKSTMAKREGIISQKEGSKTEPNTGPNTGPDVRAQTPTKNSDRPPIQSSSWAAGINRSRKR